MRLELGKPFSLNDFRRAVVRMVTKRCANRQILLHVQQEKNRIEVRNMLSGDPTIPSITAPTAGNVQAMVLTRDENTAVIQVGDGKRLVFVNLHEVDAAHKIVHRQMERCKGSIGRRGIHNSPFTRGTFRQRSPTTRTHDTRATSSAGTLLSCGTITSTTKRPSLTRCLEAFRNTAICSSCVVTFMIPLHTR